MVWVGVLLSIREARELAPLERPPRPQPRKSMIVASTIQAHAAQVNPKAAEPILAERPASWNRLRASTKIAL